MPKLATTANSPSVPASPSVARRAAPVIRPRASGGTSTTSTSITLAAAWTEACVSPVVANRQRPPAGSPCRSRAWWRAVTSADRLAADPPLTKHPPAPSGNPASPASHARAWFSAAMAPAPPSHSPPKMLDTLTTRSNRFAAGVGAVAT